MTTSNLLYRCSAIRDALVDAGLFTAPAGTSANADSDISVNSWRIGTAPFRLSVEQVNFFRSLGPHLLSFYRALNRLYAESVRGLQPSWIARALDQGKPEGLVTYSRMKRFRDLLPAVIRPDVIPTPDGMVITELDSVPGGIGLTACLSRVYTDLGPLDPDGSLPPSSSGERLVGGRDGMIEGFSAMLTQLRDSREGCIAIVVSDEAKDYRPEMTWMAAQLSDRGTNTRCVDPRDVRFTEGSLRLAEGNKETPIALIYRFFELFDLPNIPKSELLQYAVKKDWVAFTPPYKPALEEKSAFALLHHPGLGPFWRRELGDDTLLHLTAIMPRTWLLDPAPVPPQATIPGLSVGDRAIANWRDLATASQKERHFVIKPSGFSELAWGSRGVSIGHDLSQSEWAGAIDAALGAFAHTPYVLQKFHKGRQYHLEYFDAASGEIRQMAGRARLSPYYFVTGEKVELAGILATVCPADKKIIHGMKDAVLVPCTAAPEGTAPVFSAEL